MTSIIDRAKALRAQIETLAADMGDKEALQYIELFAKWDDNTSYTAKDRVRYENVLYTCLQTHTSQADWTPNETPSLWAKVLIPDPEVIPEWEQPESTNPYMIGDVVKHNDKKWISIVDNNVWEPGVYGWEETD